MFYLGQYLQVFSKFYVKFAILTLSYMLALWIQQYLQVFSKFYVDFAIFMPPKELWEAYSNRTVCPSVRLSRFVFGAYLLYSLR